MQPLRATFRCFSGCPGEFPLSQAIYSCPACGGLLQVSHDMDALRERGAAHFRDLFDGRGLRASYPYGSGVWGKKEWVAPEVDDASVVSMLEGGSNLFRAERLGRMWGLSELYVKLCGNSHTGSFKDLGMTVLVSVVADAIRKGAMAPCALACASTGDTSAALAAYGAYAGLPVVVLLPRGKISNAQLVQPLAHGAKVLALETDFDGCMAVIRRLAESGAIYLANSMNPLRIEGQKTVAIEITQQLDWNVPDWVVLPSGNLGNAAALYAGFQMMKDLGLTTHLPRLCIAQAQNANPMYRAYVEHRDTVSPVVAEATLASAIQIGNPVSAPRAMQALRAMKGVVEQASEDELSSACALADRTGLYTCPHTGVALACLRKLRDKGVVSASDRVVVVSTAHGLKFTEFKLGYHEATLPSVSSTEANQAVTLPADYEQVLSYIKGSLGTHGPTGLQGQT